MAFPWPGLDGDDPSHLKAALKYSPISGCDLQGQGQELFVCPYIISWERADRLSGCWDHTRSCRGSAEAVGGSGRCLGGALQKKKRQRGWLELSLCHPPLGLVGVPGVGCPPCSGIAGVRVPLGVSHTLAGERRIVAKSHHTP